MSIFLEAADLVRLTGRKLKSKQCEALRRMGLPFHVNAAGEPVVAVAAVEGRKEPEQTTAQVWEMPRRGQAAK